MSFRAFSIAVLCSAIAPAVASALPIAEAPASRIIIPVADSTDPVGAHAAIAQAQERLAEIDATISVLQDDADKADGAARQKARDAVASLRTIRETYRKELDGVVAQGREMTTAQLAMARTALTAPWTQFEQALDQDVTAVRLDAEQRKALVQARIRAEQTYWLTVISDLQASAAGLTAEQRAAIDARIARVRAHADEAQMRLTKLGSASQSAWSALKQGLVSSRQILEQGYRNTP